jgi:hypothetical protein
MQFKQCFRSSEPDLLNKKEEDAIFCLLKDGINSSLFFAQLSPAQGWDKSFRVIFISRKLIFILLLTEAPFFV